MHKVIPSVRVYGKSVNQSINLSIKRSVRLYHPTAFRGRGVGPTISNHSIKPSVKSFDSQSVLLNDALTNQSVKPERKALLVNDLGALARQYDRWSVNLPNVKPFYAVKCNPDPQLLGALHHHGAGFDVASAAEMAAVIKLGAKPEDIIFANPIKSIVDLQYAAKVGVRKMTFDNADELYKIKEYFPNALCVLRLLPDDSGSLMKFGSKFGAPTEHVKPLLKLAQELDLSLIGTSFHIGSGCYETESYAKAIALCRSVFDTAAELGMPRFTLLDLGGGYPGNPAINQDSADGVPAFEKFATVIRNALADHFPAHSHGDVSIIGEPGRYMATAFSTLFVYVQGKREQPVAAGSKRRFLYYVNDGVYGSFNCIMFDHAKPAPKLASKFLNEKLTEDGLLQTVERMTVAQPQLMGARGLHSSAAREECLGTHFGPTCDSMDVIVTDYPMEELFVGDWLAFENMGAYTSAAASQFNGMPLPDVVYGRSKKP
jgi:ornithine decarboxylase